MDLRDVDLMPIGIYDIHNNHIYLVVEVSIIVAIFLIFLEFYPVHILKYLLD